MRRSLALAPLCALALVLAGAALAGNGGIAPVEPKSPNASGINESYLWVSIFTGAIFLLVQGSLIWFMIRYRRRRPGLRHNFGGRSRQILSRAGVCVGEAGQN